MTAEVPTPRSSGPIEQRRMLDSSPVRLLLAIVAIVILVAIIVYAAPATLVQG